MKDFNFFHPFINKKSSLALSKKIAVISIAIIVISIYPIYNLVELNNMNNELNRISEIIESNEVQDTLALIREKNEEVAPMKVTLEILDTLDRELKEISYVNSLLLQSLSIVVPKNTVFNTLDIVDNKVYISGVAQNKDLVAILASNIREINNFYNISIQNITRGGTENYSFSITFKIKGE